MPIRDSESSSINRRCKPSATRCSGWTTVDKRDYYMRQFRDMKGAVTVEGMDGSALMDYGRICGALLAKGHARSTDATILSGYLGKGDSPIAHSRALRAPMQTKPKPTTRRSSRP